MKIDIRTNGNWVMAPDGFSQEIWDKWSEDLISELVELEAEIAKEQTRMSALPHLLKIALYEGYMGAVDDMSDVLGNIWAGEHCKLRVAVKAVKST